MFSSGHFIAVASTFPFQGPAHRNFMVALGMGGYRGALPFLPPLGDFVHRHQMHPLGRVCAEPPGSECFCVKTQQG